MKFLSTKSVRLDHRSFQVFAYLADMERQERKKKERKEIQGFLRFIIQAKIDSFFSFVFLAVVNWQVLSKFQSQNLFLLAMAWAHLRPRQQFFDLPFPLLMRHMRIAHSLPSPCVITVLMLFSTIITFVPQGSSSTTQDHLCKLFKALESFYHPSNSGRYSVTPNEIKPCHIREWLFTCTMHSCLQL